ncbi:hypothetical protein PG991_006079 [Apiospora marii]|uniref:Uncharacterized protein n=1 Tax=Apiospora marii TaxID=335849 RepID=A0ABR1SCI4_9PEZI
MSYELTRPQVLAAFLVTSYLALALILWAYWYGALPVYALKRIDRQFFFAREKGANHRGRRVFEEAVLIFSDQQLLTGFGILTGGYILAFTSDLSYYHWRYVVSLAWLSSTVHLMSLSVLRDRLWRSPVTCTIRLCAIGIVFTLLIAALVPTRIYRHPPLPNYAILDGSDQYGGELQISTPLRCLWNMSGWNQRGVDDMNNLLSIIIMGVAFTWKLCQFFGGSRNAFRLWGRLKPESYLEALAIRTLRKRPHTLLLKARYKATVAIYVTFVAYMEVFEAFMTTMLLLIYTLVWGTIKLNGTRKWGEALMKNG